MSCTPALLACGTPSDGAPVTTFRDSAGVHIAETPGDGTIRLLPWRLSDGPAVDIGGAEQPAANQLFRVAGARRLRDGRIVIANGGSQELRFYSETGDFLSAAGREGEGPGEFRTIGAMLPYGYDSLLVTDRRLRRLSVFDEQGRFARSFEVRTTADLPFASVIGVFADRSLLAQGFVQTGDGTPSGLQRYDIPLYHLSDSATLVTDLGLFPGTETYFEAFDGGFSVYDALFPRTTRYFAAGANLYVAANDTYEVLRYAPDGTLQQIVRLRRPQAAVSDADVERERQDRLDATRSADARDRIDRVFSELPRPESMPAYEFTTVDEALNLWVADLPARGATSTSWTVFDSTGTLLGSIVLPARLRPEHIGDDFVLGRWLDGADVEHVVLYRLDRPPGVMRAALADLGPT